MCFATHKQTMDHLSERQRIEILIMRGYGDLQRSQDQVCALFNELYPNRPPINQSTVSRLLKKFEVTGSVKDSPKTGRPRNATGGDKALDILLAVRENPIQSSRVLAATFDVSHQSIKNLFKREKLHPYKLQLLHELNEDDFDRRAEFCEGMMEICNNNNNFARNILFSDEATFNLNGVVNRHNCRYWSNQNPHWYQEAHTQNPQKVNVWAGIVGGRIVGPFFIHGNLNSEKYLDLLRNHIIPSCRLLFPGEYNAIHQQLWFQQDGAPPHFAANVREYLNTQFPGRWIGRRGAIDWPARSPDLNPLDFFLWGYLKSKVYVNRPDNIQDLKQKISNEIRAIPEDFLLNVVEEFRNRLGHCLAENGRHFQQLIR